MEIRFEGVFTGDGTPQIRIRNKKDALLVDAFMSPLAEEGKFFYDANLNGLDDYSVRMELGEERIDISYSPEIYKILKKPISGGGGISLSELEKALSVIKDEYKQVLKDLEGKIKTAEKNVVVSVDDSEIRKAFNDLEKTAGIVGEKLSNVQKKVVLFNNENKKIIDKLKEIEGGIKNVAKIKEIIEGMVTKNDLDEAFKNSLVILLEALDKK